MQQALPQTVPQASDEFAALVQDLNTMVGGIERDRIERRADAAAAGQGMATRPPVGPKAPAPGQLWGPSNPGVTSPLQLLAQVAEHADQMNGQMLELVTAITGEQAPARRLRQPGLQSTGLLPQIATLAHQIEETHLMTARLISHVRGRL